MLFRSILVSFKSEAKGREGSLVKLLNHYNIQIRKSKKYTNTFIGKVFETSTSSKMRELQRERERERKSDGVKTSKVASA